MLEHDSKIVQLIPLFNLEVMYTTAWVVIFSLVLLHQGSAVLLDEDCAIGSSVKGTLTPWMALITTDSGHCTGTLINNRHVLTAANCVDNKTHALVRLGDFTNDQLDSRMYEDYYVQSAMIHYLFNAKAYLNNIALLRLQRKVIFKPHIQPICLSLDANIKASSEIVRKYTAFLFGQNYEGPKKITIQRHNPNHCTDTFRFGLRESQICGVTKDRTSCAETGSPLVKKMIVNGASQFGLLGINSYGRSETCVYTNVMSYVDWIVENILDVEIIIPEIFKNK